MIPFFVTVPHSGEEIPNSVNWLSQHSEQVLMADVDRYVDQFYEPFCKKHQISFIKTNWHRYVVDLNRLPEDIDEDSVLGCKAKSGTHSDGFHWVKTKQGECLMAEPMASELHQNLVKLCFDGFHNKVKEQYKKFLSQFDKVYHLDGHSMPSLGTKSHRDPGEQRAEIVISDQDGKSCSASYKNLVVSSFVGAGFEVKENWPYKGGRITQAYGQPSLGQHCLQVELNRACYMNEVSKQVKPEAFSSTSQKISIAMTAVIKGIEKL